MWSFEASSERGKDDDAAYDPRLTGGKGANLAAMIRAGLPVPPGFVVSTAGYETFVDANNLRPLLLRLLTEADLSDPDLLEAVSYQLRAAFEAASMPASVRRLIAEEYEWFGGGPVAVRSSATVEDLPEASFAGQLETYLHVDGLENVCEAVRHCWTSLWTPRAIAYRERTGVSHHRIAMAVVIQRMVVADVAGTVFTADPVTGRRDHVVIEAARESAGVVAGWVDPQRWVFDADTRQVIEQPAAATAAAELVSGSATALVNLALRAAELFGCPQDVEWAIADGKYWLLQARPITTLFPLPDRRKPGLRVYLPVTLISQGITTLTPAGNALFTAIQEPPSLAAPGTTVRRWRGPRTPPPWLSVVAGQLYADVTPLLPRRRPYSRLLTLLTLREPTTGAALRGWLEHNADRLPRSRFRLPSVLLGVAWWQVRRAGWLTRVQLSMVPATALALFAPGRVPRRLVRQVDADIRRLERQAAALRTTAERIEFVSRTLPGRVWKMVFGEVAPLAVGLGSLTVAERLSVRWLGPGRHVEAVRRWLPHDPTTRMSLDLWRLSSRLAERGAQPSPSDPGFAELLTEYGHRAAEREIDVGVPRLDEDLEYVLELLRLGMSQDDVARRFDTGRVEADQAARRLVAQVRAATGPLRAGLMRLLLHRGRALAGLRERPKFDLVHGIALARQVLKEIGADLVVDGRLDAADEVFFLDTGRLWAAVRGDDIDLQAIAATNRSAYRRDLARPSYPRVLVSDGETIYGSAAASSTAGWYAGTPVSPGVYEGAVRVLRSPHGARLRPGEVLVAATTDPGWTPLFLTAGALVTEIGGATSHGALVAREYGLPAVSGVVDATSKLHTGQRVRVDGEAGTVTLLEPTGTE